LLSQLVVVSCAALLAACQPAGAPATAPTPATSSPATQSGPASQEWDRLVEAARREGEVNLYGGQGQDNRAALVTPFERAFPGIKVNGTFAPGRDLVVRIAAERTANKHIADVVIGPGASGIIPLKPVGALAPLEPALILPEVLDRSAWFDQQFWWLDASPPYTTLGYVGIVQPTVSYNTQLLDPAQIRSYWDLLDPKWKGKIVASDVRTAGPGAVPTRFMYTNPALGPQFLERLFGEADLTLSTDQRQMIDWLAQGRFHLGVFLNSPDVIAATQQGLPVALIPGEQFQEGAPLGVSGGTVSIVDPPPHPNAARVFVNWLLSRDGQISWQNAVRQNSLRTDVPKDNVPMLYIPKAGVKYVNAATEEYAHLSGTAISDLVTRALEQKR
jgi:iron(III) transport system substrate-binding protein